MPNNYNEINQFTAGNPGKHSDLSGLIVPITTPFDENNNIDERMFIKHLEMLAAQGVKRLLINGTTAEFFSTTEEEQKVCMKLAGKYFPGTIAFHAGHSSLKQAKRQAAWGQEYRSDAIVAILPYYMAGVGKQGIIDYFNSLAEAIEVPFILYNFPKHTGNTLDADMLSKIKHYGMKDSSANLDLVTATPNYYMGGDEKILVAYEKGAAGYVSARANAFAPIMTKMEDAKNRNDRSARELQDIITRLKDMTSGASGIARLKYAVSKQLEGYPTRVRLPLTELTNAEKQSMDRALQIYNS